MLLPTDIYLETPRSPCGGLIARCAEHFRLWREKRRWVREVRDAAALGRLDDILEDVGVTHAELDELIAAPADSGRQFGTLAAMEGVDLRRFSAGTLREAMWTCTRCPGRAACKHWLSSGVWRHDGDSRCPNATLLRH